MKILQKSHVQEIGFFFKKIEENRKLKTKTKSKSKSKGKN
jgi:hypothetical protein